MNFMTDKRTPWFLFLALLLTVQTASADEMPPWMQQAASVKTSTYGKEVHAVRLLHEQRIVVGEDGKATTTTLRVVRILDREGRFEARGGTTFPTDTGKVKEIRGWLMRPSGEVKKLGKENVMEISLSNDVYNEYMTRTISASGEADPGSIFGCEIITEEKSVFTQFDWNFQDDLPTIVSRFSLLLPQGWRAESVTFNRQKVEPSVSGSAYTWELRDLPPVELEPGGPEVTNLVPRLAVSYFPATGARVSAANSFSTWAEVSRWLSGISDGQADLNDALAVKARELAASARTDLEKIQAIGRYAQKVQYISIQTGIGRGGGYRPHAATEVFAKNYGDCKDKANLMRALLKALKMEAYLVSIYSGDPTYVREEWPSPQQFNHCIIAVRVSDETQSPAIIKHPMLGRLLIFDPTDDDTPVGDLPDHEQGSLALIVAGEQGALLRMPITPPESNRMERKAEVILTAEGAISAKISERSIGQAAVQERTLFRKLQRPDYLKRIEGWITRGATGAKVSKVEPGDHPAEGRFALDVEFSVPSYAKSMRGQLLIFKPAIVDRRERLYFSSEKRKHPLTLDSEMYTETIRIKIPDGFEVDELPEATKMDTPFGRYGATYEVSDGHLIFSRSFVVQSTTVPAENYRSVLEFYGRIRAAETAPVVLAKK
jgi:hypothetical protein